MVVFSTDWLASEPVFYNSVTGQVSHQILEVIDFNNIELDLEGLGNYLLFGYSVLGKTPIKNVRFLPPNSSISVDGNQLNLIQHEDPAQKGNFTRSSEAEIWDLMKERVNSPLKNNSHEVIIPTSGGYDSRLLNLLVVDRPRIRSFTYGISEDQSKSFEVVYAKRVSEILGTKWEQITIGEYNTQMLDWYNLYGPSTHAHGMYHMEFFKKVSNKVAGGNPFLSGIVGDAWSGKVNIMEINSPGDVSKLGYSHGISIPEEFHANKLQYFESEKFFAQKRHYLKDPEYRIVESMRMKIMLLSYLMRVPRTFGFIPSSPFLDIDVVFSMLNLPDERKKNRRWQMEFLAKNGLLIESMNLKVEMSNTLDLSSVDRFVPEVLNANLLKEVVKPQFVAWINRKMSAHSVFIPFRRLLHRALTFSGISHEPFVDPKLKAYYYYVILWPIQKILETRQKNR